MTPRVVAVPTSNSVKVVRARAGTAAARWPMRAVSSGGMAMGVADIC